MWDGVVSVLIDPSSSDPPVNFKTELAYEFIGQALGSQRRLRMSMSSKQLPYNTGLVWLLGDVAGFVPARGSKSLSNCLAGPGMVSSPPHPTPMLWTKPETLGLLGKHAVTEL